MPVAAPKTESAAELITSTDLSREGGGTASSDEDQDAMYRRRQLLLLKRLSRMFHRGNPSTIEQSKSRMQTPKVDLMEIATTELGKTLVTKAESDENTTKTDLSLDKTDTDKSKDEADKQQTETTKDTETGTGDTAEVKSLIEPLAATVAGDDLNTDDTDKCVNVDTMTLKDMQYWINTFIRKGWDNGELHNTHTNELLLSEAQRQQQIMYRRRARQWIERVQEEPTDDDDMLANWDIQLTEFEHQMEKACHHMNIKVSDEQCILSVHHFYKEDVQQLMFETKRYEDTLEIFVTLIKDGDQLEIEILPVTSNNEGEGEKGSVSSAGVKLDVDLFDNTLYECFSEALGSGLPIDFAVHQILWPAIDRARAAQNARPGTDTQEEDELNLFVPKKVAVPIESEGSLAVPEPQSQISAPAVTDPVAVPNESDPSAVSLNESADKSPPMKKPKSVVEGQGQTTELPDAETERKLAGHETEVVDTKQRVKTKKDRRVRVPGIGHRLENQGQTDSGTNANKKEPEADLVIDTTVDTNLDDQDKDIEQAMGAGDQQIVCTEVSMDEKDEDQNLKVLKESAGRLSPIPKQSRKH